MTVQPPDGPCLPGALTRGDLAVQHAIKQWSLDVQDPPDRSARWLPSRDAIRMYIRDGLGWPAEANAYTKDGDLSWCGAFAAWCLAQAGLRHDLRKTWLSSTYRLDHLARHAKLELDGREPIPAPPGNRYTWTDFSGLFDVQVGDILIVGHGKVYGDHVCLVEGYAPHLFHTLEGNATGMGPGGNVREGVVRRTRSTNEAVRLIRFCEGDYGG